MNNTIIRGIKAIVVLIGIFNFFMGYLHHDINEIAFWGILVLMG